MSDPKTDPGLMLGAGEAPVFLLPRRANRHGLIAGATGTGKTVTLQVMAEAFSARGVPVFLADVKGDLAGLAKAGEPKPHFTERLVKMGLDTDAWRPFPVMLWDVFGQQGQPVRTTISELGPLLLARLLALNEVQEGVLNIAFRVADDEGLLLLDLKDLRAILAHVAEAAPQLAATYGTISSASVGAIQRALLVLENQGAISLFGEPALQLGDLMRVNERGEGYVSILAADKLLQSPKLYATFLIWLLSELFETLPEVGDPEQPKLVLFFDEAHLLFDDAPKLLVDKIEQVVRLIRSKGVGVYFVTQNPLDVPDSVLGQLGNRVQHALRAFTPRDQKAVRAAADTFRPNPKLDTAQVITELGVGEALVSCLDAKGSPMPVERALIRPPTSRVGPLTPEERNTVIARSPVAGLYERAVDRVSAHEMLTQKVAEAPPPAAPSRGSVPSAGRGAWSRAEPVEEPAPRTTRTARVPKPEKSLTQVMTERVATNVASSVARSIGSSIGRSIVRGVLGSILKGR